MDGVIAAAMDTPPSIFAIAVILATITLALRTEAWRLCLLAAAPDKHPSRAALYCSASGTYLINLISHLLSPLVRIGLLIKLAPGQTPKPTQMITADAPSILSEITVVTVLIVFSTLIFGFPPLIALIFCALVIGFAGVLWTVRKNVHRPFVAGLNLLGERRLAIWVLSIFTAIVLLQWLRTAILLDGAGFEGNLADSVLAFVSAWATGALPVGSTAGPAGTSIMMGSGEALAGGAMSMLAASLVADVLFAIGAGLNFVVRRMAISEPTQQRENAELIRHKPQSSKAMSAPGREGQVEVATALSVQAKDGS